MEEPHTEVNLNSTKLYLHTLHSQHQNNNGDADHSSSKSPHRGCHLLHHFLLPPLLSAANTTSSAQRAAGRDDASSRVSHDHAAPEEHGVGDALHVVVHVDVDAAAAAGAGAVI